MLVFYIFSNYAEITKNITAIINGKKKNRIAHIIALVITLLNSSPNVDENNIFNDNPHPEARTPKKAPGIVRIPPTIVQIVSAPTSFVQLSIRTAMMPAVVISVPIFSIYAKKRRLL